MKIDLNKYNVEIINDKGIWIGLEDGLNVEVGICVLSNNYGVVSRYIESIYIDCFIDLRSFFKFINFFNQLC